MADKSRKIELAAELDVARAEMSLNGAGLRRAMNVRENLHRSIQRNRSVWLGGGALLGLLLSLLFPSRHKSRVKEVRVQPEKRSMAGKVASGLFQAATVLAKPVIETWLKARVKQDSTTGHPR